MINAKPTDRELETFIREPVNGTLITPNHHLAVSMAKELLELRPLVAAAREAIGETNAMASSDELKPCPFCGKRPEVRDGTYSGSAIHVSCRCGAQLFGSRSHFSNENEAIKAWNQRSKQDAQ